MTTITGTTETGESTMKKGCAKKSGAPAKKKMVTVAKGVKIPKKQERKMEKKAGGSNVGDYKGVKPSEFAGPAGGAPKYSFPINTLKRAKAALKLAHNAPRPGGIKAKVYEEYPSLKPKKKK